MKSRYASGILVVIILLLASCATLLGPREVELPLARLQEGMSRKFPIDHRYLQLFDVRLSNPRLALQPDSNRVITTMDASITPPFTRRSWQGSFTLSGTLGLDSARRAVVLTEPRMERVAIDGASSSQVTAIIGLLTEQIARNVPLYTFEDNDFRYAGINWVPAKITTKSTALVVTFEPAK
ncbi:MAG: DUF1439 domain-containing protein [Pseudomonadota bacterium]